MTFGLLCGCYCLRPVLRASHMLLLYASKVHPENFSCWVLHENALGICSSLFLTLLNSRSRLQLSARGQEVHKSTPPAAAWHLAALQPWALKKAHIENLLRYSSDSNGGPALCLGSGDRQHVSQFLLVAEKTTLHCVSASQFQLCTQS